MSFFIHFSFLGAVHCYQDELGNWHTYTFGLDHPTGDCTAVADSTSPLYSGRRLSAEEAAAAKAGEASASGRSSGSVPYSHSSSDSGKFFFQGCGSAFIFCGSGSSCFSHCGSGYSCFSQCGSGSSFKNFVNNYLMKSFLLWKSTKKNLPCTGIWFYTFYLLFILLLPVWI